MLKIKVLQDTRKFIDNAQACNERGPCNDGIAKVYNKKCVNSIEYLMHCEDLPVQSTDRNDTLQVLGILQLVPILPLKQTPSPNSP